MKSAKEILHPDNDWQDAYPELAKLVIAHLDQCQVKLSTTQLADALWPAFAGERRDRLFRALVAISEHDASDYATKGLPRRVMGKLRKPLTWAAPGYDL